MKTTLDIPDDLYQRAKVRATIEKREMGDLVSDGPRLVLASASENPPRHPYRMTKAPVTAGEDHTIPILSNDAIAGPSFWPGGPARK